MDRSQERPTHSLTTHNENLVRSDYHPVMVVAVTLSEGGGRWFDPDPAKFVTNVTDWCVRPDIVLGPFLLACRRSVILETFFFLPGHSVGRGGDVGWFEEEERTHETLHSRGENSPSQSILWCSDCCLSCCRFEKESTCRPHCVTFAEPNRAEPTCRLRCHHHHRRRHRRRP